MSVFSDARILLEYGLLKPLGRGLAGSISSFTKNTYNYATKVKPFLLKTNYNNPFLKTNISSTFNSINNNTKNFVENFIMGGDKRLFYKTPNPHISDIYRARQLGLHANLPEEKIVWTINPTLRKRIYQGAAGAALLGSMKSIVNYQDLNTPVYDYTQKRNMGSDGLGLALYYNQKS